MMDKFNQELNPHFDEESKKEKLTANMPSKLSPPSCSGSKEELNNKKSKDVNDIFDQEYKTPPPPGCF